MLFYTDHRDATVTDFTVADDSFFFAASSFTNPNAPTAFNGSNALTAIDAGEFGAFDKKIINSFRNLSEQNKYIPGLRSWIGFKQIGIEYNRDSRFSGKPKYNYFSLLKLAYDGIISFSFFPLKIASYLGFIITFFCAIYIFII